MVDRSDLDGLAGWQVAAFAAGCARRLAPVADTLCWPLPRRVIAAVIDTTWAAIERDPAAVTGGRLPPDVARHLDRALKRLLITDSIDEFGDEVADLLTATGLVVTACRTAAIDDAVRAAVQVLTVWDALDGAIANGNWVAREQQMQQQSIAVLGALPAGEALALIHALGHDEGQLATSMNAAGWEAPAARPGMPSVDAWSPDPASEVVAGGAADDAEALDAPAELLVTIHERACPLDEHGLSRPPYRPGDVLRLACGFETTEVTKVSAYDTFVRWPWPRPKHPGTSQAFPHEPAGELWTPFQLTPPPAALRAGDECHVGIVPTVVYVMQSWTSRRDENLFTALPKGRTAIGGWAEEAGAIEPYDDPIEVSLLHRAYGFLHAGDIVADADGTRLAFAPPLIFTDAGGTVRQPRWPLTLVEGDDVDARAEKVRAETAIGSADATCAAWEHAAAAKLPHPDFLRSWFALPDLSTWPYAR
jgi:hypothetical protein